MKVYLKFSLIIILIFLYSSTLAYAGAIRSGFNIDTLGFTDDGSSEFVDIPFTINFFDDLSNGIYINNNGNITLDSKLSNFTPYSLNTTNNKIIAPFFADVDTTLQSDPVTYGSGTVNGYSAFGVNWINVNCFWSGAHWETLNSFQLILIDRSDTGEGNFDIEFNYDKIVWEAGWYSGGSFHGCLGGSSARVGFSNGTLEEGTYFELPGSGIPGSFLDDGPIETSLIQNSLNSDVLGRYIFPVRDGIVLLCNDEDNDTVCDGDDLCLTLPTGEAMLNYTGTMLASTLENIEVSAVLTNEAQVLTDVPVDFDLFTSEGSFLQSCSGKTDITGSAGCVFTGLIPDVYKVLVFSTSSGCPQALTDSLLVVFDPDTPRATGGGFILPDADSTLPAISDLDKANFGFIVKLDKNQEADGNLEFQYKTADINLKSQEMIWYTTSNNKAMFQGEATINDEGLYTFRVTATDGDLTGDQPDYFDIKIWQGIDTENDPYHKAKNDLAGGSIVLHKN